MRVYIAGPMTGLPDYNFPAFHAAAQQWRDMGWEVLNPAESFDGNTELPYKDYVAHDMTLLKSCDAIAMLPGWDGPSARGSVWERAVALHLGLTVYDATMPITPPEPAKRETVCQEADRLVSGDRGAAYGHPFDDYTKTGTIWGALLHGWAKDAAASDVPVAVPPDLAILCMIGVKLSREVHASKRDNRVDTCGYAKCLDMVRERQGIK